MVLWTSSNAEPVSHIARNLFGRQRREHAQQRHALPQLAQRWPRQFVRQLWLPR